MTRGPSGVNAVQHDRPGPVGNAPAAAGSDSPTPGPMGRTRAMTDLAGTLVGPLV